MAPLHHCSYGDFPLFTTRDTINSVKAWSITSFYKPKKAMQRPWHLSSVSCTKAIDGNTVWNNTPLCGLPTFEQQSRSVIKAPGCCQKLARLCWEAEFYATDTPTDAVPGKHSSCSSGSSQTGKDFCCNTALQLAAIPDAQARHG